MISSSDVIAHPLREKCKVCNSSVHPFHRELYDDRFGYPGSFDLYRCQACGFGQLDVDSQATASERIYTEYYPRKTYSPEQVLQESRKDSRFKHLVFNSEECHHYVRAGRTLDIGCGAGKSLLQLRARNIEAVGTEMDDNVRSIAHSLNLSIHIGNLNSAGFEKSSFENVLATQVIEHVTDPLQFVKEAKEYLAPTGKLILSFPNFDALTRKMCGRRWLHYHIPFHLNFFTRRSIEELLARNSLRLERVITSTPPAWLAKQSANWIKPTPTGQRDAFWYGPRHSPIALRLALVPVALLLDLAQRGDSFVVEARHG